MPSPWLHHPIQLASLPSLILLTLFLWNGVVYFSFARLLPVAYSERIKYLLFGLTALALAAYSAMTFYLYSAQTFADARFWQRGQCVALVWLFIFFSMFSARQLGLLSPYWTRVLPLLSLGYLPWIFIGEFFLTLSPHPKFFSWGKISVSIIEARLGPVAYAFIGWSFIHLLYLLSKWLLRYRREREPVAFPLAFVVFVCAVVNDALVSSGVYRFFYLLEWGFLGFILSMGFQLFKNYTETTARLARKNEEIKSLNEEMRFLIGSFSHDLRAPLISVQGFARLLQEPRLETQKKQTYVQRIEVNTQQMMLFMDEILDFMRMGRVKTEIERVELGQVARAVLSILGDSAKERQIKIECPAEWPEVISSEAGLKKILLNLLQNALKFSHSGPGSVCIDCHRQAGGVLLTVTDQGPGIDEDFAKKLFTPFLRYQDRVLGFGLGLAIVKKTAETLGGSVWLDRNYREGAKFCVFVPDLAGLDS